MDEATEEERVVQEVLCALSTLSPVQRGLLTPTLMRSGQVEGQEVGMCTVGDEAMTRKRT